MHSNFSWERRRWSLHLSEEKKRSIELSWNGISNRVLYALLQLGGCGANEVSVGFSCGLFSAWLSVTGLPLTQALLKQGREIGVYWFNWTLQLRVWYPLDECVNERWWEGFDFPILDWILGPIIYRENTICETTALISTPQGMHPAKIEFYEAEIHRSRWPFVTRRKGATVTMSLNGEDEENGWLSSFNCESVEEATAKFQSRVNESYSS